MTGAPGQEDWRWIDGRERGMVMLGMERHGGGEVREWTGIGKDG